MIFYDNMGMVAKVKISVLASTPGNCFMSEPFENVQALTNELNWLKLEIQRKPTPWAYSRIAEIEGILAAHREESAWETTHKIIKNFRADS